MSTQDFSAAPFNPQPVQENILTSNTKSFEEIAKEVYPEFPSDLAVDLYRRDVLARRRLEQQRKEEAEERARVQAEKIAAAEAAKRDAEAADPLGCTLRYLLDAMHALPGATDPRGYTAKHLADARRCLDLLKSQRDAD